MTIWTETFPYTAGNNLDTESSGDWVNQFNSGNNDMECVADAAAEDGTAVFHENNGSGLSSLRNYEWDLVGELTYATAEPELLCQFLIPAAKLGANGPSDNFPMVGFGGDGAAGVAPFYGLVFLSSGPSIAIGEYSTSGGYSGAVDSAAYTVVPLPNTTDNGYWWVRFKCDTDGTKKLRIWKDEDSEGGTWDLSGVDTTTTSGWPSFATNSYLDEHMRYGYIAVGTNGDSPTQPGTAAGSDPGIQVYRYFPGATF